MDTAIMTPMPQPELVQTLKKALGLAGVHYKTSSNARQAIQTALAQLDQLAYHHGAGWPVRGSRRWALRHDLAVMLDYRDLDSVAVELIGQNTGAVLRTFPLAFDPKRKRLAAHRPLRLRINNSERVRPRLVFQRCSQGHFPSCYRRYLKGNYRPADALPRQDTWVCPGSEGCSVADGDRRSLVIVRDLKDYGFAQDLADHSCVFVHRSQLPECTGFQIGRHYRAIVVHVPKGLEARALTYS